MSEPETNFTPEESEDFTNLLVVGRVSQTFNILGHEVELRTLSTEEDLAVGMITKDYIGTDSYNRAYKTTIIAAALRRIDEEHMPEILAPGDTALELLRLRFKKVVKYYPIVLDEMYARFTELEKQLLPVVSRLGKLSD